MLISIYLLLKIDGGCKYKLNICTNTYIFEEILELKVFFRVIMIILGNKFFSDIPSDIFSARFEL